MTNEIPSGAVIVAMKGNVYRVSDSCDIVSLLLEKMSEGTWYGNMPAKFKKPRVKKEVGTEGNDGIGACVEDGPSVQTFETIHA